MFKKSFCLVFLIMFSAPNSSPAYGQRDECEECMSDAGMASAILCFLCCFGLAEHDKSRKIKEISATAPYPKAMDKDNPVKDKEL